MTTRVKPGPTALGASIKCGWRRRPEPTTPESGPIPTTNPAEIEALIARAESGWMRSGRGRCAHELDARVRPQRRSGNKSRRSTCGLQGLAHDTRASRNPYLVAGL